MLLCIRLKKFGFRRLFGYSAQKVLQLYLVMLGLLMPNNPNNMFISTKM